MVTCNGYSYQGTIMYYIREREREIIMINSLPLPFLPFLEFFLGYSKAPTAATEQRLNLGVCPL